MESMFLPAPKDSEICSCILAAGANVNLCDHNDQNALMLAVDKTHNANIIRDILVRTENLNARDKWGHTAFGYLCFAFLEQFSYVELPANCKYSQWRAEIVKAIRLFINVCINVGASVDLELDNSWNDEYCSPTLNKAKHELENFIEVYKEQKQAIGESSLSTQEYDYEL